MTANILPAGRNIGVAIVAPSGYPPDDCVLARGIALLQAQGCRIHNYYEPAASYQRFGGTPASCQAQLHAAAANPDVQIVMAVRGGYGLSRLLPALDLAQLAASGKLFVGHSDFTVLQMALLAQAGAVSFAGPMLCSDFGREDASAFTLRHFWDCLESDTHRITVPAAGNPAVDVGGTLWGGNLTILNHLLGTPYFPQIRNGILFIEDINEHPYRIERMLLQLLHAGVLAQQRAILLGDFSGYRVTDYDRGYDFNAMLAFIRSQLTIPVLTGLPFGHVADKLTLPVGGHAHLASDASAFQLTLSAYPNLLS
ncbi:muramoyltetrapeptide carboxypeptidase [Herminiimonas sp. CN]|uniref:muramoyltetrapeptide carboxypeptidase n=1 Tax=Herminiimonas sp. CN TaxID=1349818 RepID=UPI0004735ED7|nr:muramoyltetrapeptide carboxypeptidase [Herminiimonas sp. CN]